MPLFAIEVGLFRCEIEILHLQNHLETTIPELLVQVYEDEIVQLVQTVDVLGVGALFRWTEAVWITLYHGVSCYISKVYALVLIAWRLGIDKTSVE